MKAFRRYKYGPPDVLKLEEVTIPAPNENQVLVKARAIAINPAEWHILRGKIWLVRLACGLFIPKHRILGGDVAGEVVEIGTNVNSLKVGDRVFGRAEHTGQSEYALLDKERTAIMSEGLDYLEAASLPVASMTALDALNQRKDLDKGSTVLVNGASGGIGTLLVQMVKLQDATVHGVCSGRNEHLVNSLGADQVVNYETQSLLNLPQQYDLIVDLVGNLSVSTALDKLKDGGTFVMVGYSGFLPLCTFLIRSVFTKSKRLVSIDAKTTTQKLSYIGNLVTSGAIQPVIDRIFRFEELPKAMEYLGTRRARGKVVLRITTDE